MSTKDSFIERNEFAKAYIKDRYPGTKLPEFQNSVNYKVQNGNVLIIFSNKNDGWQAITASNYDKLSENDIILYRDNKNNVTCEFYKSELQQFLENNFLHWHSDFYPDGKTKTRLLVRTKDVDGKRMFIITSSTKPNVFFDASHLSTRRLVAGSRVGVENNLLHAIFLESRKNPKKS